MIFLIEFYHPVMPIKISLGHEHMKVFLFKMLILFFSVRSEQSNSNVFQEQNVTDLITSSYGVGPTDDNGRPLFGLRALRKTNTNQSIAGNYKPKDSTVNVLRCG